MTQVDAIYQDGVFKPLQTVELPENRRVRLRIQPVEEDNVGAPDDAPAQTKAYVAQFPGMVNLFRQIQSRPEWLLNPDKPIQGSGAEHPAYFYDYADAEFRRFYVASIRRDLGDPIRRSILRLHRRLVTPRRDRDDLAAEAPRHELP